ncbi:XRE family transcriptional regulator [Lactobacillus sp. PV034]|nr:XRE family transcriptional regulator [Lactobacillus sp. PV034]
MSNINFNDYLNEQLKDPKFKVEFDTESAKLESAIALANLKNVGN